MSRRGFLLGYALLAAASGYTIWSGSTSLERFDRLASAAEAAQRSQQALGQVQALKAAVADVDTGSSSYAQSGDASSLQRFETGRKQLPVRLDALRDLLRDSPAQLERLERLVPRVAETVLLSASAVEQRRAAPAAADPMRFSQRGRESIAAIWRVIEEVETEARDELRDRAAAWPAELARSRDDTILATTGSLLVVVASILVVALLHRRARKYACAAQTPAPASDQ